MELITEAFRAFGAASLAPQMLVTAEGEIRAVNPTAARFLGRPKAVLEGSKLGEWVDPSGPELADLLSLLSRTGSALPGALRLLAPDGKGIECCIEGGRIAFGPQEPADEALLLLRFILKETSGSRFSLLTQQIEDLRREVGLRRHAELLLERQKGVLELIVGNHPISDVLAAIAHFIEDHSRHSLCSILLFSEDGQSLEFGAAPSLPPAYNAVIDGLEISPDVAARAAAAPEGGRTIFSDPEESPFWERFRRLAAEHDLAACSAELVKGPGGKVLAVLAMYHDDPGPPSVEDHYLSSIGGDLIAIAIQNDRSRAILRRRAAQLAEADRRKDRFLAMLSHEMRNPLGPIVNTLEILGSQTKGGEVAGHVDRLRRQTTHLSRLVDDLLDISRITHGAVELKVERVDLRECLRQAVDSVRELIEARRQVLTLPSGARPLWVDGDAGRLRQVFANLLTNASKYTPREGTIEVELYSRGGSVVAVVKDDGQGLSPEVQEHLFEPFTQGGQSAIDSREGLGLGLTLVKQLVECHGGRVEAASEGVGKGTRLTIRLPPSERREEMIPRELLLATMEVPRLNVLIVEDNEDSAEALAVLLDLWGHSTRICYDGNTAVEEAMNREPDVILLDIDLPGQDGHSVMRSLRKQGFPTGDCLAVAMTGFGRMRDMEESAAAGFHHHMTKPADPTTLRQLLADFSRERSGS